MARHYPLDPLVCEAMSPDLEAAVREFIDSMTADLVQEVVHSASEHERATGVQFEMFSASMAKSAVRTLVRDACAQGPHEIYIWGGSGRTNCDFAEHVVNHVSCDVILLKGGPVGTAQTR